MKYAIWIGGALNLAILALPVDGWPWYSRMAGIVGLALTLKAWRSFKSEPPEYAYEAWSKIVRESDNG